MDKKEFSDKVYRLLAELLADQKGMELKSLNVIYTEDEENEKAH